MNEAEKIIARLKLEPHPEGGYFREIYRSGEKFHSLNGERNVSTSIYFLLKGTQVSTFHRLKSDEIWYFHCGSPVYVYCISNRKLTRYILGCDFESGHQAQLIIPAGTIFGAELADKQSFSLFGCVVSPGFDFSDFELADPVQLVRELPENDDIINRLK